jgi:hypothetical protein
VPQPFLGGAAGVCKLIVGICGFTTFTAFVCRIAFKAYLFHVETWQPPMVELAGHTSVDYSFISW